jgi:hypothetical protein
MGFVQPDTQKSLSTAVAEYDIKECAELQVRALWRQMLKHLYLPAGDVSVWDRNERILTYSYVATGPRARFICCVANADPSCCWCDRDGLWVGQISEWVRKGEDVTDAAWTYAWGFYPTQDCWKIIRFWHRIDS